MIVKINVDKVGDVDLMVEEVVMGFFIVVNVIMMRLIWILSEGCGFEVGVYYFGCFGGVGG